MQREFISPGGNALAVAGLLIFALTFFAITSTFVGIWWVGGTDAARGRGARGGGESNSEVEISWQPARPQEEEEACMPRALCWLRRLIDVTVAIDHGHGG